MRWVVNATPRPLYPREKTGTHCTGGWMGRRPGVDRIGNLAPPTGNRSPDRPARSESLYPLSYLGSLIYIYIYIHTHTHSNICVCVYISVYRERKRERVSEREWRKDYLRCLATLATLVSFKYGLEMVRQTDRWKIFQL